MLSREYAKEKYSEILGIPIEHAIVQNLEKHTSNLPSQVQLKLPKLKKVSDNKKELPKIKLPKLKKVTEV